jgi:phosphoglycolate phosphatase-like HAD superfamily hydrolase
LPKSALIIFDVDGTLLQSQLITVPAIRETLAAHGVTPPNDDAIRATFGVPVEEYEAWLAGLCPAESAAGIVEATNERELELISKAGALFPGVLDVLQTLKKSGHALAACTNASVAYLNRVLDTYELRESFQLSVCIGQGFSSKTAMVRHIMDTIPLRPAIVIGDRLGDIEAAKANGAYAIAADYGYGDQAELDGADAHARTASDIVEMVERLTPG